MDTRLAELLKLLNLEKLEVNIFRGESRDIGSPQVFGGQVLGQSLRAAYETVPPDRVAHSLHAYFLRRGDVAAPIVYFVDRSRDGQSFSSRRVTAIQHGEQIFNMSASFQEPQAGVEHQATMPDVPPPEELVSTHALPAETLVRLTDKQRRFFERLRPFEFRPTRPVNLLHPKPAPPAMQMWFRALDPLPDDDALHRALLAYVSDYNLLNTATLPHAVSFISGTAVMASIDHAMWFHHPVRVDQWLLYSTDSPNASGSRGFARGSIFSRDGKLLASTAQEGLIRLVDPAAAGSDPAGGGNASTAATTTSPGS
jgi:acyl-CoA thioesterase-2